MSPYKQPPELPAAVVMGVLIILINGFVFHLFAAKPSLLRQPSNRILLSLAVSDTISGICVFLHTTAESFPSLKRPQEQGPLIYRILTDVVTTVAYISAILHLCATNLDRYVSLLTPYSYQEIVTKRNVVVIISVIWLLSFLVPSLQFCWLYRVMDGTITPKDGIILGKIEPPYSITVAVVFVLIPTVIIGMLYIQMFLEARRVVREAPNHLSSKDIRKELHIFRTFVLIYLAFLILDFPYAVLRLYVDVNTAKGIKNSNLNLKLFQVFYYLPHLTSILNPVIYTLSKGDIRKVFYSLVHKYFNHFPETTV